MRLENKQYLSLSVLVGAGEVLITFCLQWLYYDSLVLNGASDSGTDWGVRDQVQVGPSGTLSIMGGYDLI